MSTNTETHEFRTEARQLLDLMIHSIYSNRDIFLRELISNSSDAIDKRRFEAIQHPEYVPEGYEPEILISVDKDARSVSVHDNGVGMTRDQVVDLIGTIAKSGTQEFLKALREAQASEMPKDLIGQFGVGFYSCFMVAREVQLVTRHASEETATKWGSTGEGHYTLEESTRDEPGTTVTVFLRAEEEGDEDAMEDYTEEWVIRRIVKQYSDFVAYPITMDVERTESDYDDEGKPIEGTERTVVSRETLNSMKAIWLRDKDEVSEEEYNEFYKHISHDWNEPLARIQAKIEGMLEYRLLLYIPSKAPFDLYHIGGSRHGVNLYVKRIFILDDCKDLLPEYLRFLRGVVDSEDLSLNISREMLQQNRQIERMRKGIVAKILEFLKRLKDNEPEKYMTFWHEFGRTFKEGLFQDPENRDKILDLCYFDSTADGAAPTTLQAYVDRMKDGQEAIYYLNGPSREKVAQSPHLEAFKDKGYEVLLLTEPVDEVWTQSVFQYQDHKLQSVGRGGVDLGSKEEQEKAEETRKEKQQVYASLLEAIQGKLDDRVKEVRLSSRLTSSVSCLVGDEGDLSPQLEQMLRAMGQEPPPMKRVLELNPAHPVLERMQARFEANKEDEAIGDFAELLYGEAVLAEGGALPEPAKFSQLVAQLMTKAL
ncbi:MAG: molecular chaperone HtpG [Candidatus Hydrogenedentota bacterium]